MPLPSWKNQLESGVDLRPNQKQELARLLQANEEVLQIAFALEADEEKNRSTEMAEQFKHNESSAAAIRSRAFAESFALLMARAK